MTASAAKTTTLIIPCYNEATRLNRKVFQNFAQANPQLQLVFVDDGSRDDTLTVLQELTSGHANMQVHALTKNSGKAEAVRQGVLHALKTNPQWVGFWDADLATPLEAVFAFQNYCPKFQFITGARILRMGVDIRRHWQRHYSGRVFATMASIALGLPYYDTQCGAKLIRADLAKQIFAETFLSRWLFDVELIFRTIKATGNASLIYELPLDHWHDIEGSKLSPFDFLKAPWELFKMWRRYR